MPSKGVRMPILLVLVAVFVVVTVLSMLVTPVSSARVRRFTTRHGLPVDPLTESQVAAYLDRTRRRRTLGAVLAVSAVAVGTVPHGRIDIDLVPVLAGWLAGAISAEFGSRPVSDAGQNMRSDRRPVVGVPRWIIRTPLAVAAVAVAATGLVLTAGPDMAAGPIAAWAAGALATTAVVAAVSRHIRTAAAIAAIAGSDLDDATRRQSVGAITGVGTVLAVLCLLHEVNILRPHLSSTIGSTVGGVAVLWTIGIILIGATIAAGTWRPTATGSPTPHYGLPQALTILVVLAIATASWAGYSWWHDHPPYGSDAIGATVTIRFTDDTHFAADTQALGVHGLGPMHGDGTNRTFIGRLDYTIPHAAHGAGSYFIVVIDKRTNRLAPWLGDDGGSGEDGFLEADVPARYAWLSALAPVPVAGGWTMSGADMSIDTDIASPLSFEGEFPDAAGLTPADLLVALIFVGPDQQIYWATRVTG
jgi:hypothetical protein